MKRKIASYIRDHMQLVVGHQRTIGTLQQDEEHKLVETTLLLKVTPRSTRSRFAAQRDTRTQAILQSPALARSVEANSIRYDSSRRVDQGCSFVAQYCLQASGAARSDANKKADILDDEDQKVGDDLVVPLERNLCGHPLAGLLWEGTCEEVLF